MKGLKLLMNCSKKMCVKGSSFKRGEPIPKESGGELKNKKNTFNNSLILTLVDIPAFYDYS